MSAPRQTVDTVIESTWIAPVDGCSTVLANHAIAVDQGRIVAVGPAEQIRNTYAAKTQLDLSDHLLIPGLINLHTHAAMALMRGIGDDRPLMDWLRERVWPVEMKMASPDWVRDGTLLACAEMIRGGITCFNDMYMFPEAVGEAALQAGMRAALGIIVLDFASPYAADPADYLSKGLATRDALRDEPLLSFCMAPHSLYAVSNASLEKVVTYAEELDLPIHTHVHETAEEIAESVAAHGMRPLQRMEKLGMLGPSLTAVHAVHLDAHEPELLARHGAHVAHCPSSNLKLASGIAPVARLLDAGVNVGIGTDGAASNNRLDVLGEMRLATLLAKGTTGHATALPALKTLEMATINAARALGLDGKVGSLEVGKQADITAIDLSTLNTSPCFDPISHLVYAADRSNVAHVWVAGEHLLDQGRLTRMDAAELTAKARYWHQKITGTFGDLR